MSFDPAAFKPDYMMLAIRSGLLDSHLDDINRWIRLRQSSLAEDRIADLMVGDKIRISNTVSPKLLAGTECEVIGFEGIDKVKVRLLHNTRSYKWREGMTVTLNKHLVGDKIL